MAGWKASPCFPELRVETVEEGKEKTGIVFNIQQFSVHDGPGIRTIVFLKGCPLQCRWCSNPESQKPRPELAFDRKKCIGQNECGRCLDCPQGAIGVNGASEVELKRDLCNDCGVCAEECPSRALEIIGGEMSVRQVLDSVEKDFCFYSRSGGGLTLSGGEPLFQPDFAIGLLKHAKSLGMHTAIETCGHLKWEVLEESLNYTNSLMYDIKCMDPVKHREFTGVSNTLILENFEKICRSFPQKSKIVRTPIVPGFNDNPEEIESIAEFIRPFPNVKFELLPYHRFGERKYELTGRSYLLTDLRPPDERRMLLLRNIAQSN
jgi:pyruvate formate lyase activating enzyme